MTHRNTLRDKIQFLSVTSADTFWARVSASSGIVVSVVFAGNRILKVLNLVSVGYMYPFTGQCNRIPDS